jgi:hypothetical protein
VLALAASAGACHLLDQGLTVTAPDKVETTNLEQPEQAGLLVTSAVGDFECALGSFVVAGGLMSDELLETTSTAARWSYDRRSIDPSETLYSQGTCEGLGVYSPVQTARFSADHVLKLLQGWTDTQVPNRTDLIATAAAYGAYSRLLLGEAFCSAAIDGGPELSSMDIFKQAEDQFGTAIDAATAANDPAILNLALVGRARARLDQGNTAGAGEDAALVPSDFVFNASADLRELRRENRVVDQNNGLAVSVAPAYRALTVSDGNGGASVPDTRVTVVPFLDDTGGIKKGADHKSDIYLQTKYADASSPIPIASGTEAQLILAESKGGQDAVDIINTLRTSAGLPAYAGPTDAASVTALIAQARARELFLEGQHLYDQRRLNLPLVPAAGAVYSLVYKKGGNYGDERCMPLPDVERLNNPSLH